MKTFCFLICFLFDFDHLIMSAGAFIFCLCLVLEKQLLFVMFLYISTGLAHVFLHFLMCMFLFSVPTLQINIPLGIINLNDIFSCFSK